jgi:hypothetical protein
MTTTIQREKGATTVASDKIKPTRFPFAPEMVCAMLCADDRETAPKDATLSDTLAVPLKLTKSPKIEEINLVKFKDGGTQSQNFVVKLKGHASLFMKILSKGSTGKKEQQDAEKVAHDHISPEASPFVIAAAYVNVKVSALDKKKVDAIDLIVFENIDSIQIINEKDKQKRAAKLGKTLGSLYKSQMEKEGRLKDFYKGDGTLSKVFVHDDFQMSNILLAKGSDKVFLVDLGGLAISANELDAYRNLREAIEMTASKEESQTLLEHFVLEFDPAHQHTILTSLVTNLKKKATPDLTARGTELDTAAGDLAKKLKK